MINTGKLSGGHDTSHVHNNGIEQPVSLRVAGLTGDAEGSRAGYVHTSDTRWYVPLGAAAVYQISQEQLALPEVLEMVAPAMSITGSMHLLEWQPFVRSTKSGWAYQRCWRRWH